ncbi:MAG: DUF2628 domain-containing protein, partial [Candidatus Competibacteraceae bacterium]|nr:DUF2628 domain-containing protein [Candidatus Competibacteraceae bacterium]
MTKDELQNLERKIIGEKYDTYYREKFKQLRQSGSSRSWNWSAFFFTGYWCLYRHVWIKGVIFIFIFTAGIPLSAGVATVVTMLICGYYGNYWLMQRVEKKIAKQAGVQPGQIRALLQ